MRPVQKLLLIVASLSIFIIVMALFSEPSSRTSQIGEEIEPLDSGQLIRVTTDISDHIYVGEPFEYKVRVIYRPDKIKPDFRQLVRDIRFVPFEQLHKSRTSIVENNSSADFYVYELAYSVVGINVIPGTTYTLDSLSVNYSEIETEQTDSVLIEPVLVTIEKYYQQNAMDIPLQPVKGLVIDDSIYKQIVIVFCLALFFILGMSLIWTATRRRNHVGRSKADMLKDNIDELRSKNVTIREKIIQYEKIILSLFKHYGNRSAKSFWSWQSETGSPFWEEHAQQLKQPFERAYTVAGPVDKDIHTIEDNVESVFTEIDPKSIEERLIALNDLEGTILQRISKYRFTFVIGLSSTLISIIFIYLFASPEIWRDRDAVVFNNWIDSLPPRLLDETKDDSLGTLDVEMLGHISDQQLVLENLQTDKLRSSYLYNYGTIVAKAFKVVITMPPEDEEEIPEPPSFEFPLLLLSNSARFYPYDEDIRRNLELVISLKESQKDNESGEVQGELGPPTPGFSRDMNPVLF
jgi:hypothetical protein